MRKTIGILLSVVMLFSVGLSEVRAETITVSQEVQFLEDTPTKYGFKGLYTLYSPATYQKGQFGMGIFWDMTRFCLPGDPRYPQLQEFTLAAGYGITDRLEVAVAAPFRSLKIPAASSDVREPTDVALEEISESGFSNLSVGIRYNLVRSEGFEMTPYIQAFLPTAQDPEKGLGAENTRIHLGLSAGTRAGNVRLYSQVAYQYATAYDQDRRDFTERDWWAADSSLSPPRFDYFGTNPLYHEYGNTLFYGAGMAIPIIQNSVELFSEFLFYHAFDDPDYIPMFEDYNEKNNFEPLDVVQDGGMANVGIQAGFGNGLGLIAGWGGILFAEEPMYESPTWKAFAGLTYNSLRTELIDVPIEDKETVKRPEELEDKDRPIDIPPPPRTPIIFDCKQALEMINFEFDKSTLTDDAIQKLKKIGKIMRLCDRLVLEVQGHTDWVGTENYNYGLGNRRARAVVYYLVYDEGIDPSRIVLRQKLERTPQVIAGESYGETDPIASNETDAGRAQNRSVRFVKLVEDNRVLGQ